MAHLTVLALFASSFGLAIASTARQAIEHQQRSIPAQLVGIGVPLLVRSPGGIERD